MNPPKLSAPCGSAEFAPRYHEQRDAILDRAQHPQRLIRLAAGNRRPRRSSARPFLGYRARALVGTASTFRSREDNEENPTLAQSSAAAVRHAAASRRCRAELRTQCRAPRGSRSHRHVSTNRRRHIGKARPAETASHPALRPFDRRERMRQGAHSQSQARALRLAAASLARGIAIRGRAARKRSATMRKSSTRASGRAAEARTPRTRARDLQQPAQSDRATRATGGQPQRVP